REDADTGSLLSATGDHRRKGQAVFAGQHTADLADRPADELAALIEQLSEQMHTAAGELQFEVAARLRDEISDLQKELRQMIEAAVVPCTSERARPQPSSIPTAARPWRSYGSAPTSSWHGVAF